MAPTPQTDTQVLPSGYRKATHVIFDMDGLLIDSEKWYTVAIGNVVKRHGGELTWEIKESMMGLTARESAATAIRRTGINITVEQYLEEIEEEYPKVFTQVSLMPGVERFVKHMHANGIPMAVATSSKTSSFKLKTARFREFFDTYFHHIVLASDDPEVTRSKPDPQTYLVCASRFNPAPAPANCLAFEDSPMGVKSAMSAGMQCVMIPDPRSDVSQVNATIIIPSMKDIKPELFGLPPFPQDS